MRKMRPKHLARAVKSGERPLPVRGMLLDEFHRSFLGCGLRQEAAVTVSALYNPSGFRQSFPTVMPTYLSLTNIDSKSEEMH